MHIGKTASFTHPGRKRRRNEDSFVSDPPLFAIADGMGGAQAGALASRLAAGALREREPPDGAAPEEHVVALVQEANRRVHERATEDADASGMGTTMTVALVEDDRVVFGHVGDSRAYIVRDGELRQLTDDHSLVAELVRSGKLSPEEADSHPQRSVITRALGPDASVDVDTFSVEVQPGDLFLLCSDGLTSMIGDDNIVGIVRRQRDDLDQLTRELVQAANDAGGEDNITVVCFELTAAAPTLVTSPAGAPVVVAGPELVDEEEDTLDELADVPAASITTIRAAPVLPAEVAEAAEQPAAEAEVSPRESPRRRRPRWPYYTAAAVILVALLVVAGLWAISRAHFVGARSDGHVAVYQGLPYNIVGGVHLYREVYVSPVLAAQLSQPERRRLFNHNLVSNNSAMATVRQLEQRLGQQP